jgi:hypothetical protein
MLRGENPVDGQTAVQTEGDEKWLTYYIPAGQPPFIMTHH